MKDLLAGGFRSRKLLFALFAMLLVFLGALLAGHDIGVAANYPKMVDGIEAITAIYLVGNVGSKWAGIKANPKSEPKED